MAVQLASIIDQVGQRLSINMAAARLYVDFKSAFNQLRFNGMMLKLYRVNCPIYLIAWLKNYLSG